MNTWRIEIDRSRCRGTGICATVAPGRFAVDDMLRSSPVHPVVDPDDAVLDATESCPLAAITVFDTATSRVVAPHDLAE
ncbi:hypothetical protein GCM10010172_03070 [Paractinoplanes ferrugineus]|uniref:Ferredoxin n=1 Tax=Paractinoplanes ferrugineus TaxID=113564 RepID=A0A919MMX5_9ACTN|nr:ferredoxin [Actinoplanes ferrugineus]GIE13712.1 hypothetical protein Afe05nite_55520 [Actinoplanes ferrugineus]